jgi:predicted ArsR family transcriptional regulator
MTTCTYDPQKLYDSQYAFGVLCSQFLDQFGQPAEETITRLCREMGQALGDRLRKTMGTDISFESAIRAFVGASRKSKSPATLVALEENRAVLDGAGCPFQLNGRGRRICETLMAIDQAILESASGRGVAFQVVKSLAQGDDHCRVIFEAT